MYFLHLWGCCLFLWAVQESTCVEVRLVPLQGGSPNQPSDRGRLEVNYNGQWGTVCDDGFTYKAATVVCKMLGYNASYRGTPYYGAFFGEGSGPIHMDDVECTGDETDIEQCSFKGWGKNNCIHKEDVGLRCLMDGDPMIVGMPRLAEGTEQYQGRVELNEGSQWGTICDDGWDQRDAQGICTMMGLSKDRYYGVPYIEGHFGAGTGRIMLEGLRCNDRSQTFESCLDSWLVWGQHDCNHLEDVGVWCKPREDNAPIEVRLVGGQTQAEGRVEVKYQGVWGTISRQGFDTVDATVICKMLGYRPEEGYYGVPITEYAGKGRGPIWLEYLQCHPKHNDLSECDGLDWGNTYGYHEKDAGMRCTNLESQTAVRLYSWNLKEQPNLGLLEVRYRTEWGTVCHQGWDDDDARVICLMLGYPASVRAVAFTSAHFGEGWNNMPIWLNNVDCPRDATNIQQCRHDDWGDNDCDHDKDVGVWCDDNQAVPYMDTSGKYILAKGVNYSDIQVITMDRGTSSPGDAKPEPARGGSSSFTLRDSIIIIVILAVLLVFSILICVVCLCMNVKRKEHMYEEHIPESHYNKAYDSVYIDPVSSQVEDDNYAEIPDGKDKNKF